MYIKEPKAKQEIVNKINNFVNQRGGDFKKWYLGISKDAFKRLFDEHQVEEKNDNWIIMQAMNAKEARQVENVMLRAMPFDGGTGGGDNESDMVYAYRITPNTVQ